KTKPLHFIVIHKHIVTLSSSEIYTLIVNLSSKNLSFPRNLPLDFSHNRLQNLTEQRYLLFIQNLRGLDLTSNLFHTINLGLGANINIPDVHLQTLTLRLENFTAYESGSLGDIQAEKVRMSNEVELMGMNPKGDHSYLVKLLKGRGADNTSHLHLASMVITWEHLTNTVNAVFQSPIAHLSTSDMAIHIRLLVTPHEETHSRGGGYIFLLPGSPLSFLHQHALDILVLRGNNLKNLQILSKCSAHELSASPGPQPQLVGLQRPGMPLAVHLNLSSNGLSELVFSCLPNSTPTLGLQNNQISNVPETLLALDSLLALYLSTNRLRNLPVCAGFPHLKYLLLTENSLHAPSLTGLGACPVLQVLNASRNPFTCSLRGYRDLGTFGTGLGKGFQIQEISCNIGLMIWQWTQAKHHSRTQQVRPQDLEGVLFHSFVSYSQHNADGVKELRARGLHICRHERDFVPGKTIVENIIQCVERSRRSSDSVHDPFQGLPMKAMMGRHTYLEWPQDRGKHRLFWATPRALQGRPGFHCGH
uniref:TIR domain-containing protein n=1 Tax=Oncorhynchus tshawytscha TaxID=74940 RepID=A0AAZ3QXZ5_ONCTS